MARVERIRETLSGPLSEEYLSRKAEEGWKPVAVEWERQALDEDDDAAWRQAPFGLRTPDGSSQLEEDPAEQEVLQLILGMVIDDRNSLGNVAEELNRRGFHTRQGMPWSPSAVFNMMPRLVEVAPQVFARPDWSDTRKHLAQ